MKILRRLVRFIMRRIRSSSRTLVAIGVLVLAIAGVVLLQPHGGDESASPMLASDRVAQSKTMRCGYVTYEPFVIKDPNTGKLSGVTVDYLNQAAARQGYRLDWAQEVTFDQVVPALDTGKIDLLCVPCTPDTDFAKVLAFVGNLGGLPYYTYGAAKEDLKPEALPTATFVLHDGFALSEITRNAFPKAHFISLGQTASMGEFFDQLKYGKAQAAVTDTIGAENYMRNNPGTIRRLSDKPVIAMRMFLVAQKADAKMHRLIEETFGLEAPANLAAMKALSAKYGLSDGSLLLGEACRPTESEKGWKICAP